MRALGYRRSMPTTGDSVIDVSFHVESDANGGDPDRTSPTLRRYHQLLWSKPLPDGTLFTLAPSRTAYLHHSSVRGEFFLASDAITHSYRRAYVNRIGTLIAAVPAGDVTTFYDQCSTIGAYILFPGDARDRKPTINGARGMHPRICDRFDLTLECIRRHYARTDSPLSATLDRYADYFALFEDFDHYVDFFLLGDLIQASGDLRWLLPFDDFTRSPLPRTVDEYASYRQASIQFVRSRNHRILDWAASELT